MRIAPMLNAYEKEPGNIMKATNLVLPLGLVAIGVAVGAAGIYVGDTDDAPGAALIGILLMLGVRSVWCRRPHHSGIGPING